ncbi:MAG: hypothetical protein J6I55_00435 [Ruminococcus sp.]|nr:hypothetical protein [Ruminococcus sp.]
MKINENEFFKEESLFERVMNGSYFEEMEEIDSGVQIFCEHNLFPKDTGVDYKIWVDDVGKNRNVQHNRPRLKVELNPKTKIPVAFDKFEPEILVNCSSREQKEVSKAFEFIKLNRKVLLRYWYGQIDKVKLMKSLKKL